MVRYLFYTIGDLTYQSPLVNIIYHVHPIIACCIRSCPQHLQVGIAPDDKILHERH